MDLPRPLEPRATHNRTPSVQEPRRHEQYGTAPQQRTQLLPGVRDILSPGTAESSYGSHDSWRPGPSTQHYFPEQRYHAQHPPAYPPRQDPYAAQDHRLELPILDTRHQANLAPSPFGATAHLEPGRDYDSRPRQSSASSYAMDSVLSPYTPSHDENGTRSGYDRNGSVVVPAETGRRYVGIRDFPEGQFHVYDDGHKLPTHIDGEQVNPQWGLTKANKPRKRLALACMDCREKKIKCEPGATSCLQCEKAKRPCRRNTSNHNQHDASSTTEWSSNAGSPPATRPGAHGGESSPPMSRNAELDTVQKRRAQDELTVNNNDIKRQKSMSPLNGIGRLGFPMPAPRFFSQDTDPCAVDPALTTTLLKLYFEHINRGVYSLFPGHSFLCWAGSCTDKSQTDRMVLHAMMALATVFRLHEYGNVGEHCASLAAAALNAKFGRFSLGLVHIRLLLALYNFAKNCKGVAWEHCGAAMRAISALRFNNEEGCSTGPDANPAGTNEYGLTYNQAVECRRRTFWCGFMMDRFNGFCEGMLCTVDKADVYLKLPCAELAFENGSRSQAPFFDNGIVERADAVLTSSAPVSLMAHLALITSIWGDVMNFVYRGVHRSSSGHAAAYEAFYADTYKALQSWSSRQPSQLAYTQENLQRSIRDSYAGDFVTMHILYHYALLKLNRCMRWSLMAHNVPRNIGEAYTHAQQLLSIAAALNTIKDDSSYSSTAWNRRFSFSTPFIGFAVVSAVDVISAGGPDANLGAAIESMREGLTFLQELAPYWSSACDQAKAVERRFFQLSNVAVRPFKAASGCWLGRKWGLQDPLERELDLKDDCIYGVENTAFFGALEKLGLPSSALSRAGA